MLKTVMIFLLCLITIAIIGNPKKTPKETTIISDIKSEYEMKCEQVYTDFIINVHRCENKETICYKTTKGISCLKKENQKE